MRFPSECYETLAERLKISYPTGEEKQARWIVQTIDRASRLLAELLKVPAPIMELLLLASGDWHLAPPESESLEVLSAHIQTYPHPYWATSVEPPCLVIPAKLDALFGKPTPEKLAFMLYHEMAVAFLERDTRPWPEDSPLWSEEWQLQFAALWLSHKINGQQAIVNRDLHEQYADIFEPEEDGKTPVTVRGFDWDEDTNPQDYLCFSLLLERLAADLLRHYGPEILLHFLDLYRKEGHILLSDDATQMLATALGPGGADELENFVYF